jgi:hypothetical protein
MQSQQRKGWSHLRLAVACCAGLSLLTCASVESTSAQGPVAQEQPAAASRLAWPEGSYTGGGTLGFRLIDTPVEEQLYRRSAQGEQGLMWLAHFGSRWPLNEDQLDRWSAQVAGLVIAALGPDVRLDNWVRLDASEVGEQRVAYHYLLASASGERLGEATIVVFAVGTEVGLTTAAGIGIHPPANAAALARRLLDREG